jgi:hypothetical protein
MTATDDAIRAACAGDTVPLWERLLGQMAYLPVVGCRLWSGSVNRSGYGQLSMKAPSGRWTNVPTHRLAFAMFYGMEKLPPGGRGLGGDDLVIDHRCRMKTCFNPKHLQPIPSRLNIRRSMPSRNQVWDEFKWELFNEANARLHRTARDLDGGQRGSGWAR